MWLKQKHYFTQWYSAQDGVTDAPTFLHWLCWGTPKLRTFLSNIRSPYAIRNREKALVFCQYPATCIMVLAALQALIIPATILTAYHHGDESEKIIEDFNVHEELKVLIMTYAVGATGLNLQNSCRRIHLIETPFNQGIFYQAIGRVRRLGNPYDTVFLYEYFVQNTIDDQRIRNNIEKALPQVMAEINKRIFSGSDESEGLVDIGEWVFWDGNLRKLADVSEEFVEGFAPEILNPTDILRHILLLAKGEILKVQ